MILEVGGGGFLHAVEFVGSYGGFAVAMGRGLAIFYFGEEDLVVF